MIRKLHEHLSSKSHRYKSWHNGGNFSATGSFIVVAFFAAAFGSLIINAQPSATSTSLTTTTVQPVTVAAALFAQTGAVPRETGIARALEMQQKDKTIRKYKVTPVDLSAIKPGSTNSAITLDLFDGETITINKARFITRSSSNYTWVGNVRGSVKGDAVFTVVDGLLTGTIILTGPSGEKGAVYDLHYVGDGLYSLNDRDYSSIADEPDMAAANKAGAETSAGSTQTSGTIAAGEATTIDVMILFTNQSGPSAGAGLQSEAQAAVDVANLTYSNNGLPYRLNLVYAGQIDYNESSGGQTQMLSDITGGYNGAEEVSVLRDTYRADMVSLFVNDGGWCGYGWIGGGAGNAFTVVNRGCATGNLSFPHELGHNFSLNHDPQTDSSTYPYAYNHGYIEPNCTFRTVMAYPICATRVPYHSNPRQTYLDTGLPMGDTGTSDAYRVLTTTMPAAANYKTPITGTCSNTNPSVTVSPTSASGSAGQSVTYTVTIKNNDSNSCPGSVFMVTPALPAGFTQTPASITSAVQPGSSASQNVTVTSPTSGAGGSYQINETAVNTTVTTGSYSGSGSATYTITVPDYTAPVVSIVSPLNGTVISAKGSSDVVAKASDQSGIRRIEIHLDNQLVKTCNGATSCTYKLNAGKLAAGAHTIKSVAVDNSPQLNQANTSITVMK